MKPALLALALLPSMLLAQTPDHVRVLLPFVINTTGQLNSNWQTQVLIHNANGQPLVLPPTTVMPFSTTSVVFFPSSGNPSLFLDVPAALADHVITSIRVHDVTRDADSWGVEIPGIPESQFGPAMIIAGIPADARFRTLLRLYGDGGTVGTATVTLRDDATGALIDRVTVPLLLGDTSAPAYGQLALDALLLPVASAHPTVRAEITNASAAAPPLWAFVTITNNITQQVTTLLSHPGSVPPPSALQVGHWGNSNGICMEVTDTQAVVQTACAVGRFLPPATIGTDGHFEVDGFWMITAGPVPINPGAGTPAHFSGVVQGTTLMLTVTTKDGAVIPITLEAGSTAHCTGIICL